MEFIEIAQLLSKVSNTSSTLEKQHLLHMHRKDLNLREVLKFIYYPYFKTGIGKAKLANAIPSSSRGHNYVEIMSMLRKSNTGTAHIVNICAAFIEDTQTIEEEWLATGIVTQDLQIGVSVTLLNKIFGKTFIPKIGIMRGMLAPSTFTGVYIATEKIDGNRRLLFTSADGPRMYTRSGKPDLGLVDILEQAKQLPIGYVYDCECTAEGIFTNNIELRQATASIANSGGNRKGLIANVFDMVAIPEYEDGISVWCAAYRKYMIAHMFNDKAGCKILDSITNNRARQQIESDFPVLPDLPNIKAVPIMGIVHNQKEALDLALPLWEAHLEGVMLVEYRSPYEVSPNPRPTLLKIKNAIENVCKIMDVVEGENKYEGMLGAIVVNYHKPGVGDFPVKIGSGFTDYEREIYWQDPYSIIGKYAEVESFGESRNSSGSYSLSCPVLKRIVDKPQ